MDNVTGARVATEVVCFRVMSALLSLAFRKGHFHVAKMPRSMVVIIYDIVMTLTWSNEGSPT